MGILCIYMMSYIWKHFLFLYRTWEDIENVWYEQKTPKTNVKKSKDSQGFFLQLVEHWSSSSLVVVQPLPRQIEQKQKANVDRSQKI